MKQILDSINVVKTKVTDIKVEILVSVIAESLPKKEREVFNKIPVGIFSLIFEVFAFLTGCNVSRKAESVEAKICYTYYEREAKAFAEEEKTNGKRMKAENNVNERRLKAHAKAAIARKKRQIKTNKERGKND